MERDKYDMAIDYLTENPDSIECAWSTLNHRIGGCLFELAGQPNDGCGCLTQIRGSVRWSAATPKLTREIRADERIPASPSQITVASLPVFAEWQRRLDKELNRV